MPVAKLPGLDVYYERAGSGPTLLYISGSGADLRNQPNQFDSPLAGQFDLVGYDQRGLGQTGNPGGPFTMQQYADDAACLLDHLGLERVLVMGVSFGGMVAQEFALRHQERVRKLVLACTSSGGAGGASYPLHELAQLPPRERAEQQLKLADLRRSEAWIAAHPDKWQRLVEQALERRSRDGDGPRKQLEARRGHDTYARLSELRVPVLLAGGAHDGIAPAANMEAMHARIARGELRLFTGGHLFLAQDREAYPYIIQWLMK